MTQPQLSVREVAKGKMFNAVCNSLGIRDFLDLDFDIKIKDFIDQIITLAQEEKIEKIKQFDEYQFLRGLGIDDGDSMNAEEIGDVCEQLKQRFINILKQ